MAPFRLYYFVIVLGLNLLSYNTFMLINCCKHFHLSIKSCKHRNKENLQANKICVFTLLSSIALKNDKKIAFLKGPGNKSKYRLSFKKFCVWRVAERTKILRIWTASGAKQKYTELLMGENQSLQARFFPAKRLSYFLVNIRHHSKAQTFFSMDRFPA